MSSCAVVSAPKTTKQAPRFTTVDKVLQLKVGMTYKEVVKTLGSPAYDMQFLSYETNQTVYLWYYKKIERLEDPAKMKTKAGAASGEEVITKLQKIYITFDDGKKLTGAVTDTGKGKEVAKVTIGAKNPNAPAAPAKPFWKFW